MITFDRVSKRYDNNHDALREVSFEIAPEELVFLTGHPTRGRVVVGRQDIGKLRRGAIPRHRQDIGVVFQNHKLLMDRTVYDNVALPLMIAGYDHRDMERRVSAALDKVGLLDRATSMPMALSGGEQQRVGIARAVVGLISRLRHRIITLKEGRLTAGGTAPNGA